MHYFIRIDLDQPEGMPTERVLEVWHREIEAAQDARASGLLQGWKVVGQRTVLCIADFPDHEALDRALALLPTVQQLGGAVRVQAWPVRPYDALAEDAGHPARAGWSLLGAGAKRAVHGGLG